MIRTTTTIFCLITMATLAVPASVHACPGCNGALNNSVGFGFNTSILFMMSMPFVVAGAIGIGLIYTYRRAQKKSL
jgi:hypothetical protein